MIRAVVACVVTLAALAPEHAEAKGCHETASVVGYTRCRRFGWTWSKMPAYEFEVGAAALRFDPGLIDQPSSAVGVAAGTRVTTAPGDHSSVVVYGVHVGQSLAVGPVYLAQQTMFGSAASGPQLVSSTAVARGATMSPSATGGFVMQQVWMVGVRHTFGPITVGTEAGPGFRIATLWTGLAGSAPEATVAQFVLDVHQRAIVWLSPHWSIGAQIGVDIAHPGSFGAALVFGGHLAAYDKTR